MLKSGYSVYVAAFKRYQTINKPMSYNEFLNYIEDLDELLDRFLYNTKILLL